MSVPAVSVVVCTYNRIHQLEAALASIARQELGEGDTCEVVVVDDGSTDGTAERVAALSKNFPVPLRCVRQRESVKGVAAARNLGVETATGAWVAFFDDDRQAEHDWLAQLLAVARASDAACVGGPIRVRLPVTEHMALGPVSRGLLREHPVHGAPAPFNGKDLPSTGNLLVRRGVFKIVGLFNPKARSGEETDFVLRVREAGMAVYSAPGAVVWHVVPPYRLRREYLRRVSQRWGSNFAVRDLHHGGLLLTLANVAARFCFCFGYCLPRLVWFRLHRRQDAVLDERCRHWRFEGYVRRTLASLAPRLFAQRRFFDHLDFRGEREFFHPRH